MDIPPSTHLQSLHHIADQCPYDFANMHLMANHHGFIGSGADLSTSTLLHAYRCGVFPWFDDDEPICWWSPKERCVMLPDEFTPKKSLMRTAKKQSWHITTNLAFTQVIEACSQPRAYADSTWIHQSMKTAYQKLHQLGVAVSVEVWENTPQSSALIGGLYGVNIGAIFCGESMFHRQTDASKIAFWGLMTFAKQQGITLIDCQLENPHLMSLGASVMPRQHFLSQLTSLVQQPVAGLGGQTLSITTKQLSQKH